ncbi:MAG: hypothetical protein MUE30_12350 [Spirosomaceae bacterium]|nr:hypothetical protein [Spirosomataceae bacterium]
MENTQNTPHEQPDFQHGYNSGVEDAENRQAYEKFLVNQVNQQWITERVEDRRRELTRIETEISDATTRRKSAYDRLQEYVQRVHKVAKRVAELTTQRDAVDAETESLRHRRKQTQSEYSLLAGFFFFAAGLAFVFGDLIISHEIVAYALNIRNTYEAWAFAVGLAMISILLKPAYDRLIERPYTEEYTPKSRTRYAWFKVGLAGFALVTLGILGWFRYEAYRTDKLKEAINKSIKNLQLNATPLDPTSNITPEQQQALLQKIEQQLLRSDELNLGLVNSPWALASFVLSGILFALAGAVSLGMALPVLQNFWYRWLQIDPRLGRLRRRRKKLMTALEAAEKELADETTQQDILAHELEMLPSLDALRAERQQLRADIEKLLDEMRSAQSDTRIASFNDGYAKGEMARELMSEEEFTQFRNSMFDTHNLALKASTASDRSLSYTGGRRAGGLRPHQMIRKIITDDLNNEG